MGAAAACSLTNAADDPVAPSTGGGGTGADGGGGNGGVGGVGGGEGGSGAGTVECGDGTVNGSEDCDDQGESATCDDDCTAVECGDDTLNATAGETCEGADAISAGCCDANSCTFPNNCSDPIPIMLSDNGMGVFDGMVSCPLGGSSFVAGPCDSPGIIGTGGDQIFQFNLPTPAQVQVSVNANFDAALRLMGDACNANSQIPIPPPMMGPGCANQTNGPGNEVLTYPILPPGDYFVAVDGVTEQDAGDFSLSVNVQPILNPFNNPSFETGDYTGWTILQQAGGNSSIQMVQGPGPVNQGTLYLDLFDMAQEQSGSPALPINVMPSEGMFAAVWLSDGPDNRRMYQDFVVPGPNLTFDMAHFNSDGIWDDLAQYIAINIRNPADDTILATPFKTGAVFPVQEPNMTSYNVDVSAFVGQMVRVDVEVQGQNFFLDAVFDNFDIQ